MTSLLTTAGAALAVVASAVGLVVTIEQLTLRARLRKTVETTKALKEFEGGNRAVVLTSIHDVAVARLIAGWLVPGWRFAEAVVWLLGAPIALGFMVWQQGLSRESWTFGFFAIVAVGLSNRRALRLVLERQRVARQYLLEQTIGPARIGLMHQMEGGTRKEFLYGFLGSVGAVLIALGSGALAHDPETGWPLALLISGFVVLSLPWTFIEAGAVHPAEDLK